MPNTAPEAPPLMTSWFQNMLALLPHSPANTYSAANQPLPNSRSVNRPLSHNAHMLNARCTMPK